MSRSTNASLAGSAAAAMASIASSRRVSASGDADWQESTPAHSTTLLTRKRSLTDSGVSCATRAPLCAATDTRAKAFQLPQRLSHRVSRDPKLAGKRLLPQRRAWCKPPGEDRLLYQLGDLIRRRGPLKTERAPVDPHQPNLLAHGCRGFGRLGPANPGARLELGFGRLGVRWASAFELSCARIS
jgi:hypothetical protein